MRLPLTQPRLDKTFYLYFDNIFHFCLFFVKNIDIYKTTLSPPARLPDHLPTLNSFD